MRLTSRDTWPKPRNPLQRSNSGAQPLPFSIDGGKVHIGVGVNDPALMARSAEFLVAFFAGVPNFVWEDLGFKEPPISRELDGF